MNPPPQWPDLVRVRLMFGRDRARTLSALAEQLQVSRRTVEAAVESLRREGAPICTGADGVWLTDSAAELRDQYRALRARYIRQAVNARALLRTAQRYDKVQQTTLFGDVA